MLGSASVTGKRETRIIPNRSLVTNPETERETVVEKRIKQEKKVYWIFKGNNCKVWTLEKIDWSKSLSSHQLGHWVTKNVSFETELKESVWLFDDVEWVIFSL